MSAHAHPRLTPEQYLEIERSADFKSEYYDGRMYAMSGGSFRHGLIIGNLTREVSLALRKKPCSAIPNDLRVAVSPQGLFTYPDVVVVCGEPRFAGDQRDTLVNPTVVLEVLSPSTEGYDRGFKSEQYRSIESLQEYGLISQVKPHIEVFRRQPHGQWLLSDFGGLEAVCRLESIGCEIALCDIYEKVDFGGEAPGPPGGNL